MDPRHLHLVCGSGGSRAVLGSAGAILACQLAGISNWHTVGGVSGGAVPTVLLAGGMPPAEIVRVLIELDFASLLTRKAGLGRVLLAFLLKDGYERIRPTKAVFSSEKAGTFIESHVPCWPKNYWTIAAMENSQWLFTSDGVFEYSPDGTCCRISQEAAPLGLAVRASCAVPGVIAPVPYKGQLLFDGALTMDGRCPVGAIMRHFNAAAETIVACDVGEYKDVRESAARKAWRAICGANCLSANGDNPPNSEDVVLIKPSVNHFPSLAFALNSDQKWQAVMSGFLGTIQPLSRSGLLSGDVLEKALVIRSLFEEIQRMPRQSGELSAKVKDLLASHGLF